jgi:hypothetical protein
MIFFPGFLLLIYDGLFAIDRSSRVRSHRHFHEATISQNRVLIALGRIAIWDKHKVAVAMAIGVWAINSAFFIQGESLLPYLAGDHEQNPTLTWFGHRCRASECYIPITLNHLCLLHP